MLKKFLVHLFLTLIIGCSQKIAVAQKVKSPSINQSFSEIVDSIVKSKISEYQIPGIALGIVQQDSVVYAKGYGLVSIKEDLAVNQNTLFHTASISKLFTATAIMQLIKAHKITLDTKLVKVAPEINYKDVRVKYITIKQLLNHTSGLPDIKNYHWKKHNQLSNSLNDYITGLHIKLKATPSTTYLYSNLGYDILGFVVEKITNSSFEEYIKLNILDPSGMLQSDFRNFRIPDSLKAKPHSKKWITGNIYRRKTYPYTREHAASSTLNSSAYEFCKWMIWFMNKSKDEGFNIMLHPSFGANSHIGLGFQLSTLDSLEVAGHYGGDKGFRSYLLLIPQREIGLVILANGDYNENFRQEILHPIAKMLIRQASNNQ